MPVVLTPNGIRAQVVFKGISGLPEDTYVNTFHYLRTGATYAGAIGPISGYLFTAYNTYMSQWLAQNLIDDWEIRMYDLEQGAPRTPTIIPGPAFQNPQSSLSCMPEEVALCMSFHGAAPVTARKRGRVFIGPLNDSVNGSGGGDPTPKPQSTFINNLAQMGDLLIDADEGAPNWTWAVYSPTENVMTPVVGGWVDDAFDIQRRRGRSPEARVTFDGTP